jgi:hypothetical protein
MANLPVVSNRLKWGGAVVAVLFLVLFIIVGSWLVGGRDDSTPSPAGTPVSTSSTIASPSAEASASPEASPDVATPVATPQTQTTPEVPGNACLNGCLVRVEPVDAVMAILEETGERPSYESEHWVWTIASRKTVDRLQDINAPVYLIHDSPETLYLYVTRLPEGQEWNPTTERLGQVLDNIEGQCIVLVPSVPPIVTEIVNERIWIEKLRPAAPSVVAASAAGTGAPLADSDLGVLLPQVDVDNMWQTVVDLQGMSSTDGTGVGTRQYSRPGNVMTAEYLFTRLESYGLEVWYEDFITWEGYLSSNVVGEIPGRDESMIYGVMAHLDSTAVSFDEAPGADDNASGVAGALEIARILAGYELKHPVHIIFVNAEEVMIIGSMAYANAIVQNGTPIEGIFNLDTIANPVYGTRLILNSGPQSAWMTDLLIKTNDGYGLGQNIMALQTDSIISDDTMLRRQGIESVLIARLLADDYGVHHSADDTIDAMSFDNTLSATQLVLLALAALVQ